MVFTRSFTPLPVKQTHRKHPLRAFLQKRRGAGVDGRAGCHYVVEEDCGPRRLFYTANAAGDVREPFLAVEQFLAL